MNNEVEIQLEPGETLEDAILRIAKKHNGGELSQIQQEILKKAKKEKKVTVSDPSSGSPVEQNVYGALHIYRRGEEPEGLVRSNATRERKMHGPGMLVFCHMHPYGEECTPACKERVAQ